MEKKINNGKKSKTKQKFIPLFSKEGEAKTVAQLPGRHVCQCLASRHKLIGNCIKCGRIVCKQEGSGPCLYCGALVCSKEEKEIMRKNDRKGEELLNKLMNSNSDDSSLKNQGLKEIANALLPDRNTQEGLEKALQHKKQLLEFDKTCERRTQVIDDDADYFSTDSNQWLSPEERQKLMQHAEELKNQKYIPRSKRKITVDFAGRQIEEPDLDLYDVNNPIIQGIFFNEQKNGVENLYWDEDDRISDAASNLKYEDSVESNGIPLPMTVKGNERTRLRLQDSGLQEMSDEGWCLSIHQPYASFIVLGIKKHEGRTWYTPHRGRLWIAAASKQPSCKEVMDVENAMKIIHGNCVFPEQYPVSCLLGCIDLVDCLSQEQYMEQYPEGESGSPYVFICENPQELIVKFPVQGKHKLYKLDERIHQAALKMMMKKSTTHS